MLFFTLLRIILLATNLEDLPADHYHLLVHSFFYGFRFDTCISCYLLALPFVLTSIGFSFQSTRNIFFLFSYYLILVLYGAAFFICCADIPYYHHFSSRITTAALLWSGTPMFTIKMILGTFTYWIYLLAFFVLWFVFIGIVQKLKLRIWNEISQGTKIFPIRNLIYFFVLAPFVFLGIRGRMAQKSPIRTGTAYFCDNNFLNQLGLNPVFTFLRSAMDDMNPRNKSLHLMDDATAIQNVKKYLGSGKNSSSPVERKIGFVESPHKMNVVIVIMEGMGWCNMPIIGKDTITPFLYSLKKKSLWFDNIYTQGIHTFNGIYSSLFSYPALLKKHPLQDIPSKQFYSMPLILKENGYNTAFFITHDGQFDNEQGFLSANGFDKIYSQRDYPSEKVLSTLGVPDDYLFEYAIPKINELAATGKNFFCGFMTASNHDPIVLPSWAKINYIAREKHLRILQYADWSLRKFIQLASQQSWYNNTIFVFVADHGANHGGNYEMPLSYHHSPLIIFAPGLHLAPKSYACMGGQLDIFPTLMGLMHISYLNNTMGVDMLHKTRPFIYFTADDKIGCMDKEYFFIHLMDGRERLYHYKNQSAKNLLTQYKAKADSMRTYSFSMLQTTQWMMDKQKFAKQ